MMTNEDRSRFGKRLRQIRLAKSMTQEALAERGRLHSTYVGGVERGERNVGLDNILKLAQALDVHPSALFVNFGA